MADSDLALAAGEELDDAADGGGDGCDLSKWLQQLTDCPSIRLPFRHLGTRRRNISEKVLALAVVDGIVFPKDRLDFAEQIADFLARLGSNRCLRHRPRCRNAHPLTRARLNSRLRAMPWAALIAAGASILVALGSGYIAIRAQRHAESLERFRREATRELELLKIEREERAERERRQLDAEAVLSRYREPLLAAAYDLQSRLYNILHNRFLEIYGAEDSERREEAVTSTVFRFAQYFGWTEILRQDIHSWRFTEDEDTRAVGELLQEVQSLFRTDAHWSTFMLWSDEQRAIGELMIAQDGSAKTCFGYARFIEIYEGGLARWLDRLKQALNNGVGSSDVRLSLVQGVLRRLVIQLDPSELRYDHSKMRVSLPRQ